MITYKFFFADGHTWQFPVEVHRKYRPGDDGARHADWARLEYNQCSNCPLKPQQFPNCPVAADIESVVERFKASLSYERARVEVHMPERTVVKECDTQTGLRSLMGLVMATSACPLLSRLKCLARMHLPFASLEETLFRAVGYYLLQQYYIYKSGGTPDMALDGLEKYYEELETLNACLARRFREACQQDANLNAVVSLFYLSLGINYSITTNLDELKQFFNPD
jgi:hypothetical protein